MATKRAGSAAKARTTIMAAAKRGGAAARAQAKTVGAKRIAAAGGTAGGTALRVPQGERSAKAAGQGALEREVASLRRRLDVLEDERAILRLMYQYAHTLDYGQDEAWTALFAEDGVLEVTRRETSAQVKPHRHEGRAALRAWVESHTAMAATPVMYAKHFMTAPLIEVKGNTATSVAYAAGIHEYPGGPMVNNFGRNHDTFVKRKGRWLFQQRTIDSEAAFTAGDPLASARPRIAARDASKGG